MEVLVILLFIILLFVILSFKKTVNQNVEKLSRDIERLREELAKKPVQQNLSDTKSAATILPVPDIPKQKDYWETSFKPIDEPAKEDKPDKKTAIEETITPLTEEKALHHTEEHFVATGLTNHPPPPPEPGFFERHPDLEKFIGENLVNKIGIAILVLAIGFFVKYAIDNNWIGPVGRVGIGILCGGILTGLAHRLRTNYKGFSSVLAGGGLAIFYFTIALAYHQFHLFNQLTSFIIMIVITVFAVVLSILYNRQELAVIALVGGFAAPFMVSNGSGDYQTLFAYLLVLNTGLLVIAYNKAWRLLNLLSFIFTLILFGAWILTIPANATAVVYRNGLLFATAFYLLFFIINIANNIKENKRFIASDFGILLLNTSLYFAAGLYFITVMHADNYRGLFSAAMAVFNLSASYLLFRKQQADKNILYLLIGITLTFVSLTAPLQLHGNYITLFWASETVLLYWLYQRSGIGIMRYSSFIIWMAMLVSLLMDWFQLYNGNRVFPIIFNKGFITGFYVAAASYLLSVLVRKDNDAGKNNDLWLPGAFVFTITGLIILFTSGVLEINHQFLYYYPNTTINQQYIALYTYVFVLLYTFITQNFTRLNGAWQASFVLMAGCLFLYLAFIQPGYSLLFHLMIEKKYIGQFTAHWAADVTIIFLFSFIIKLTKKHLPASKNLDLISWLLCAWLIIFLSTEAHLLSNRIYFKDGADWYAIGSIFEKTALPILWGLCSFAFMWLGMHYKYRTLRVISLVLFSLTLVKLFAFDIRNIPAGGKIAAFFCLGVLLLVVSFMYQRLKRIIIEDEKKSEA